MQYKRKIFIEIICVLFAILHFCIEMHFTFQQSCNAPLVRYFVNGESLMLSVKSPAFSKCNNTTFIRSNYNWKRQTTGHTTKYVYMHLIVVVLFIIGCTFCKQFLIENLLHTKCRQRIIAGENELKYFSTPSQLSLSSGHFCNTYQRERYLLLLCVSVSKKKKKTNKKIKAEQQLLLFICNYIRNLSDYCLSAWCAVYVFYTTTQ